MPPMGDGPSLDRWARIQFRRVHLWVFSTSRFVPLDYGYSNSNSNALINLLVIQNTHVTNAGPQLTF